MKKILVTQRLIENQTYKETREALDVNYSKLVSSAGFLPIVLPYENDFVEYFQELDVSGVLLTGGNDLNSCNPNELSKKRDVFEKKLIKYSIDNEIPIYGICRGLQIIAEYFGSTFKEVKGQVNTYNTLNVSRDSLYSDQLQMLGKVNSFHNYAVKKLGNELTVSAMSEKIIKAVEHKKYKIFAQMWHSERESTFKKSELQLIKSFFK